MYIWEYCMQWIKWSTMHPVFMFIFKMNPPKTLCTALCSNTLRSLIAGNPLTLTMIKTILKTVLSCEITSQGWFWLCIHHSKPGWPSYCHQHTRRAASVLTWEQAHGVFCSCFIKKNFQHSQNSLKILQFFCRWVFSYFW